MKLRFTKRQIFTFIIAVCVNFFCSLCASLQAPFYPAEAEKKGATATEYGFVFGSFELMCFLSCPFFGKIVKRVKPKLLLGIGLVVTSISVICFGFLDFIQNGTTFISFSLMLRISESLGSSAAVVSAFSIVSCIFENNIGTVMSTLEMFYGLGFIVGPTMGGILFQVGGFPFPFICVGVITAIVAILILLFVPHITEPLGKEEHESKMFSLLKNPEIALNTINSVVSALNQGFISATLEPHLRQFNVSQVAVGFIFVITGTTYALTSPIFGRIADKYINPKHLIIISLFLNIIGYSIIGPLPILPIPNTLGLCMVALFIIGLGLSSSTVSCFIDSVKSAIEAGFPKDISTYGLLSGLWTSSFSFGAFIGPSVAGILYDLVGFQYSTLFVILIDLILLVSMFVRLIVKKWKINQKAYFHIGSEEENENTENMYNAYENKLGLCFLYDKTLSNKSLNEVIKSDTYGTL